MYVMNLVDCIFTSFPPKKEVVLVILQLNLVSCNHFTKISISDNEKKTIIFLSVFFKKITMGK